jgi:hypothetical protein
MPRLESICLWCWATRISVTHVLNRWRACSLTISLFFFAPIFFLYAPHSSHSSYYSLSNKVIVRWENEIKKERESEEVIEKKKRIAIFLTMLLAKFQLKKKTKRKQPPSHYFQTRFIKQNKRKMIDLWTILLWVNIERKKQFHRRNATVTRTHHSYSSRLTHDKGNFINMVHYLLINTHLERIWYVLTNDYLLVLSDLLCFTILSHLVCVEWG